MKRKKRSREILARFFKSKYTVLLAIVAFWGIGTQIQEVEGAYKPSTAYQYYLLGTKSNEVVEGAEETDVALNLGSLGSGGVSGQFSYDDLVNSAPEDNKEDAKQFASTMATYSTFGYFSNRIEGFGSILSYIGRALSAILLVPAALLMDVLQSVVPAVVGLLVKLNVIVLLASLLTDLGFTSPLAEVLGITTETVEKVITLALSFAVAMILLSLAGMFKKSGTVDQYHYRKFKGRVLSLITLPVALIIGATFLNEMINLASSNTSISGSFERYFVDTRSWAYNFNFAPNGNDGKDGNIVPSSNSSYVDLKYNPYTSDGGKRIKQINSKSALINNGSDSGVNFGNSALTLSFIASESFSAVDFINYKGSEASATLYGSDEGKSFGSYYQYAINAGDQLVDVSQSYYPSGGERKDGSDVDKKSQKGGYASAVADYGSDKKLKVPPQVAWRDRFIYGAKNSGENIDKYYSEKPSLEQISNEVGDNNENAFSNQSMFLMLSTMFDETGGKYYIDAPARGVLKAKASFDSNRSTYYVVSMVGSPIFTMFGLIAVPIIQLVILLAILIAVLSMGLIEMNARPLRAWLKGITLGDIEYTQAILVYSAGIGGTVLSLIIIPPLLASILEYVPKAITLLELVTEDTLSPQASLALHGIPLIMQAIIAIFIGILFIKSPSFRHKLIDLFTLAWAWARVTGGRLEDQASGGMGRRVQMEQDAIRAKGKFNASWDEKNQAKPFGSGVREWMTDLRQGVSKDLNFQPYTPPRFQTTDEYTGDVPDDVPPPMDAPEIRRNGQYERVLHNLEQTEMDRDTTNGVQVASIDAQEAIVQFRKQPSPETYRDAMTQLDGLEQKMIAEGTPEEKLAVVGQVRQELNDIVASYDFEVQPVSNTVVGNESQLGTNETHQDSSTRHTTNVFNDLATNDYSESRYDGDSYHDNSTDNQSTNHSSNYNTISDSSMMFNESLSNITNDYSRYESQEVQQLSQSLGSAGSNQQIIQALNRLDRSRNDNDLQIGMTQFRQAVSHLNDDEKGTIDVDKLQQSMEHVIDFKLHDDNK